MAGMLVMACHSRGKSGARRKNKIGRKKFHTLVRAWARPRPVAPGNEAALAQIYQLTAYQREGFNASREGDKWEKRCHTGPDDQDGWARCMRVRDAVCSGSAHDAF